jgi:hypothetical protein
MEIFCLPDFKKEYEKLISKKSYKSLTKDIADYFFDKDTLALFVSNLPLPRSLEGTVLANDWRCLAAG